MYTQFHSNIQNLNHLRFSRESIRFEETRYFTYISQTDLERVLYHLHVIQQCNYVNLRWNNRIVGCFLVIEGYCSISTTTATDFQLDQKWIVVGSQANLVWYNFHLIWITRFLFPVRFAITPRYSLYFTQSVTAKALKP